MTPEEQEAAAFVNELFGTGPATTSDEAVSAPQQTATASTPAPKPAEAAPEATDPLAIAAAQVQDAQAQIAAFDADTERAVQTAVAAANSRAINDPKRTMAPLDAAEQQEVADQVRRSRLTQRNQLVSRYTTATSKLISAQKAAQKSADPTVRVPKQIGDGNWTYEDVPASVYNAETSRQNAETSRINAETSRKNAATTEKNVIAAIEQAADRESRAWAEFEWRKRSQGIRDAFDQGTLDLAAAKFEADKLYRQVELDMEHTRQLLTQRQIDAALRNQDIGFASDMARNVTSLWQSSLPYMAPEGTSAQLARNNTALASGQPVSFSPVTAPFPYNPNDVPFQAAGRALGQAPGSTFKLPAAPAPVAIAKPTYNPPSFAPRQVVEPAPTRRGGGVGGKVM